MDVYSRARVRAFIRELLGTRGDDGSLDDSESLFVSGRLESIAAVELVCFMENEFGIDFVDMEFDISIIDSIDRIESLAGGRSTRVVEEKRDGR
jgi:acyl carrier protein